MIMKAKLIDTTIIIITEKINRCHKYDYESKAKKHNDMMCTRYSSINTSMDWQAHAVQWSQNWSPDLT